MRKENLTIVKTRKDFMDSLRSVFIPACNKTLGKNAFNFGYAMNNWTSFWICVDDDTLMVVELHEEK